MLFQNDRLFEVDPWRIIERQFRPDRSEHAESIFSLSNEYMGTRGTFEEEFPGKTLEGCYIGGVFVRERISYLWKRRAFPTYANTMTHTTNWLRTIIEVDGERFDMGTPTYTHYVRELDMRRGLLSRSLVFETSRGLHTMITWERLVSHDDPHIASLRVVVRPLDHSEVISIHFQLDGRRENTFHGNSVIHSKSVYQVSSPEEISLLKKIDSTGHYYIHRMLVRTDDGCIPDVDYTSEDKAVGCRVSFRGDAGRDYAFEKIVSVWTSRDLGYPFGLIPKERESAEISPQEEAEVLRLLREESRKHAAEYAQASYESIRDRHIAKIASIWDDLDIEIAGDELSQQGIRYCMFQLFSTYSGRDSHLNIGAKGLTGEWYFGRYFWDSEAYCLPYYLLTNQAAARNLLECRYDTLDAARARAREFGYDGACYAWQTIDGTEDCGVWEYVFGETHINAIVPYAIYLYTRTTGEKDFLYSKGIEVLIEESRYWATRTSYIPYRNGYGVLKCMGPDEYQQVIDNNYYTNYMARWTLTYTMQVIEEMEREAPEQLRSVFNKIGFTASETEKWREIAAGMLLTYSDKLGVFVQDDSFLSLEPLSREELDKDRDTPIEAKWTIERFQRHDLIKQPDVLMLFFLFRDAFPLRDKMTNYRFYEQRTIHGSSLSPSIHSILATEVGRHRQAYEYYLWASRLDLDDFNNNAHEGLHISSMAGTWMNIVFGFGGLAIGEDSIKLDPALPSQWESLTFNFVYRGRTVRVDMDGDTVRLRLVSGEGSVPATVYSESVLITRDEVAVPVPAEKRSRSGLKAVIFGSDRVVCSAGTRDCTAWTEQNPRCGERDSEPLAAAGRVQPMSVSLENRPVQNETQVTTRSEGRLHAGILDHATPADALPGIASFLAELRRAGIRTAVWSTGELGPVARRLGVPASECLVIVDTPEDAEAAATAGMRSIGIGCKMDLHLADYVLSSTRFLTLDRALMVF